MKPGTKVKFYDTAGTLQGIVQGPIETLASGESYVPVWVDERPGGREGTTMYVNIKNLIEKKRKK